MSSFSVNGANATLSYRSGGSHVAKLRCNGISVSYGLNSTESHARQHRAFYPHRRAQGGFALKFECKGWAEANQFSLWLKEYAKVAINLSASDVPPPMTISVPSREFTRLGIPKSGIAFGDHLGSMVFTPMIAFVSVSDPSDASTSILKRSEASGAVYRNTDPTYASFYPESVIKRPGKLADQIYASVNASTLPTAQQVQDRLATPSVGRDGMRAE